MSPARLPRDNDWLPPAREGDRPPRHGIRPRGPAPQDPDPDPTAYLHADVPRRPERAPAQRGGGEGGATMAFEAVVAEDVVWGGEETGGRRKGRAQVGVFVVLVVLLAAGLIGVASGLTRGDDPAEALQELGAAVAPAVVPEPPAEEPTTPPSPTPSPSPTPPPPDPADAPLTARLEALMTDPDAAGIAVAVVDEEGRTLFSSRGEEPLLPASTQKLLVAAAALAAFGPDHRFPTTAEAAGPIEAGVLRGDLVLRGGGDPSLATPVFADQIEPDRPETRLDVLADRIVAAGVRQITGRVVGDGGAWSDQPLPSGWLDEYLSSFDGVRTAALTVDAGRRLLPSGGEVVASASEDPPGTAAEQLAVLLTQRGVSVDGGTASVRGTPPGQELGRVESPPLRDLLTFMVQTSDNQIADMLFRSVGAAAGDGSWEGAARATEAELAVLGLDWSGTVMADGSGLSRDNRVTAALLANLDRAVSRSDAALEWERLMAVSGQSGTLRRRLTGTVAEGRLRGKTGSLRDVRSLAGAVIGPDGSHTWLAVIANDLGPDRLEGVRRITDEVILSVTEHRYGCERLPRAAPAPDQLPYELRCAS